MRVCERFQELIEKDLIPYIAAARDEFAREGDNERVEEMDDLLRTFVEIIDDIQNKIMDEWECGELYEAFKRSRESGEFLDKIT
jgi:hypothetical protein